MSIGISDEGKSIRLTDLDRFLVEVDPGGVEMAVLKGIKEMKVLHQVPVQRIRSRKIGVGSNNERFPTAELRQLRKLWTDFARRGVQKEHMTPSNRNLHTRDEENSSFLGVGE